LRLAQPPNPPKQCATLKEAFKDHFRVGTAINRSIATGNAGFRRTAEEVNKDIALVKEQFNQVVPENEMKWMSVHPRAGKDGYDWAAADAFVEFGTKNHMELAGHTLVWHSQTPNWVFEGTHLPPEASQGSKPAGDESKAGAASPAPTSPPGGPTAAGGAPPEEDFVGSNSMGLALLVKNCSIGCVSTSRAWWAATKAGSRYGTS
jgi:hypothetical protein